MQSVTNNEDCVAGLTTQQLNHLLRQLASPCDECSGPKLKICMERCCIGAGPYCQQCSTDHFLHITSDIRLAFVGTTYFIKEDQWMEKLHELLQVLERQKLWTSDELTALTMRKQELEKLSSSLKQQIEQLRKVCESPTGLQWHDELYQQVVRLASGQPLLDVTRKSFQQVFGYVNMFAKQDYLSALEHDLKQLAVDSSNLEISISSFQESSLTEKFRKLRSGGIEHFMLQHADQFFNQRKQKESALMEILPSLTITNGRLGKHSVICTERMVINKDRNRQPSLQDLFRHFAIRLPDQLNQNLSELHSEVPIDKLTLPIESLGLVVHSSSTDICLPRNVKVLRLFFAPDVTSFRHVPPKANINFLLQQLPNLDQLQQLYIGITSIDNRDLKRLVSFALKMQLRMMQIILIGASVKWTPHFERYVESTNLLSTTCKAINLQYQSSLLIAMALQKKKHLRHAASCFKNEILCYLEIDPHLEQVDS